jgi:NAD-dependent SIR2 family protein deacetylase
MSAAAGLTYSGKRFEDNFAEFIAKYGIGDMYSAGFYPYPSEEARWGYWSKHVYLNRIEPTALELYKKLYKLVEDKEYFVLTTNVDHQFQKAGFTEDKIFATQGDYGRIQCAKGCHAKTYDAIKLFEQMNHARKECLIPTDMVPKCPVCGGPMAMHLRCDQYFVEDAEWHKAAEKYGDYLEQAMTKETVLIELGVGFNTPTIIRFPFEKMMREHKNLNMVRCNLEEAIIPESFGDRAVGINHNILDMIENIGEEV